MILGTYNSATGPLSTQPQINYFSVLLVATKHLINHYLRKPKSLGANHGYAFLLTNHQLILPGRKHRASTRSYSDRTLHQLAHEAMMVPGLAIYAIQREHIASQYKARIDFIYCGRRIDITR